uniref:BACK domain-containing protein n=1 Tax=Tetranychus urticae TaxID=32264 RepID=T1JYA8_TETUR
MDSLEADDQLTVVNRSTEYRISKQLIRKIPYFEKMLNLDLMESKENKVELDFDEQALESILNWLEFDHFFIELKNVINLCTMTDYFGMGNNLINDCATYFHDKFSIKHLPVVIPQVTPTSRCINSGVLNAFICRHFLKLAGTKFWLNYPIETIEYICALDLMVHSEMQVFNAIMKWVNFKTNSRKDYFERLLKLVGWCHLDAKHLSEIKENFKPLHCTPAKCNGDCPLYRINQHYFVLVETLTGTDLQIKVLDRNFMSFIKKVIKLDASMPLHLLHDEHVSDIVFDSGRQMIRVDWIHNKYRLLDLNGYKSHYYKIRECILEKKDGVCNALGKTTDYYSSKGSLFDVNGKFVLTAGKGNTLCYWLAPTDKNIEESYCNSGCSYLATVLDNNIYTMKTNIELIQFNIDSQKTKKFTLKGRSNFGDLILTSKPAYDDKVFLIDKSKNFVDCFNVNDEEWSPVGLMANYCSSIGNQNKSNKLLAFTSAFLCKDIIRSCINHECK